MAAISASIAAAAKTAAKKLAISAGTSKKGRSVILVLLVAVIIIILLPVIVLYGIVGWMSDGFKTPKDIPNIPASSYQEQLERIETTFYELELGDADINKAKMIYLSCLYGKEVNDEDFYEKYAECFKDNYDEENEKDFFDRISETFGVCFSESEKQIINEFGEKAK